MEKPLVVRRVSAAVSATAAFFRSKSRRQSLLILVAYVSAIAGVFMSLAAGDPYSANDQMASIGIGLMGLSFALLFLLSISITNLYGGEE